MFLHCRILSAHVGAEADDADGGDAGVDQDEGAINVAVVEQALKAAPRRCRKSGKKSVTVTEVEKTEVVDFSSYYIIDGWMDGWLHP